MAKIKIVFETGKDTVDEIRGDVDDAVAKHFPVNILEWRWQGDVLHMSGPGAAGTMVFESGRLRVQATLKPPASLIRPVIEHKIRSAFDEAFGRADGGDSHSLGDSNSLESEPGSRPPGS